MQFNIMIFINEIIKEEFDVIVIKMDIAKTDLEKIIKDNIENNKIEDDKYIDELLKEILNVLIELKE